MKGFSSKRIALKIDVLQDRLRARPCIFQPGNLSGWGSEGVNVFTLGQSGSQPAPLQLTDPFISVSNSWLGLHDFVVKGQFMWANSHVITEFTNWASGEPDDSRSQSCGTVTDDGVWFDDRCQAHRHPVVCEMRYSRL